MEYFTRRKRNETKLKTIILIIRFLATTEKNEWDELILLLDLKILKKLNKSYLLLYFSEINWEEIYIYIQQISMKFTYLIS